VELLNEIRQGKGVLENQEQKIHYQREEIVSLQVKVSQQATEITELYSKCMYAFILFMYQVEEYRIQVSSI
jgi:predicted RNase H-like nuclease (RuvC/YqgF family)